MAKELTEEGVFYESLNLASLKKLPIIFFVENNRYSVYSPLNVRQPNERSITEIAKAQGIRTFSGDGNKAEEVINVCKLATEHVRKYQPRLRAIYLPMFRTLWSK